MQYTGKSIQQPFRGEYRGKEYIFTLNYPYYGQHVLMRHFGNHMMELIHINKNVKDITQHTIEYVGLPPLKNGFKHEDIGIIVREFGTRRLSYEGIMLVYSKIPN